MALRLGIPGSKRAIESVSAGVASMACAHPKVSLSGSLVTADSEDIAVGLNGEVFSLANGNGETAEVFAQGPSSQPAGVLQRLYRRHGIGFVSRLRGFFSVAIWDSTTETLYLATDRHALRPLYYRQDKGRVVFASEVKALLAGLDDIPAPDVHGITDFLLFGLPWK